MRPKRVPRIPKDIAIRFWSKVQKGGPKECWKWTASVGKQHGYGQFKVGPRMVTAHRVAFFLGTGKQPASKHVLHKCDNKLCCNPRHLFLGTNRDNIDDFLMKGFGYRLGHSQAGERNGNARLSAKDVQAIRRSQRTQQTLALMYGITQSMVSRIKLCLAWKEV